MRCYIGIGSNIGDRIENIRRALVLLKKSSRIKIKKLSGIYRTEPWGKAGRQRDYFNLVAVLECVMPVQDLLRRLKEIEKRTGRKERKKRWAAREIDLDILFCGDLIVEEETLQVPHPLIPERFFVLKPLADVAPDLKHPLSGLSVKKMLAFLKKPARLRQIDEEIIP